MSAPTGANRAHLPDMDNATVIEEVADYAQFGLIGIDEDFVAIYKLHYARLVRALELGGVSQPTAEDVAQEAFARTLGHWRRVRRGTNPAGYVYRVAFRLARRSLPRELQIADERPSVDIAAEATLQAGIDAVLRAMPAARRRCAVLCLVVGMSTKDAASALRIAESTVRKQIERARTDLRLALNDDA